MYQSLLPILKPLVFEGKTGSLQIVHKYNDQAQLFLREGIIEQVETTNQSGKQAMATCARWISITTKFQEGELSNYTPNPEIDTNSLLSYLEKTLNTVKIINKKISNDSIVLQVDTNKLSKSSKLTTDDFKTALLFDGTRSIKQALSMSDKSELAVLAHACRLIMAGVAKEIIVKDIMPKQEREDFLHSLSAQLTDMVGPAGQILVDDALEEIGSGPDTLAREDILPLTSEIGALLEDEERIELARWTENYIV